MFIHCVKGFTVTDSFSFHVLIITVLFLACFHLKSTLSSTPLPGITCTCQLCHARCVLSGGQELGLGCLKLHQWVMCRVIAKIILGLIRAVAWGEIRILNRLDIFHNWKFKKMRTIFLLHYLKSTFSFVGHSCAILHLGHLLSMLCLWVMQGTF